MNKITATGRIVADAELRFTQGGDPICGFRMASDVGFGDKKTTNWFSCTIWGKRGEALSQHLAKGTPVTVFGTLTLREWQNKEGIKQLSPDIRVDEIEMHGGKRDDSQPAQQRQQPRPAAPQAASVADLDDDLIPF